MVKHIIGLILTIVGGLFIVMILAHHGAIFPHILGPIALAVVGIILLILKRKGEKRNDMDKKHITLLVVVVAVIVVIGILISVTGPDLMRKLMQMHRGG